jgi:hypothetical protein
MSEIRTKPANKRYRENFDRIFKRKAGVVQLVEQLPCKQRVEGSIPSVSSRLTTTTLCCNNDPHFGG